MYFSIGDWLPAFLVTIVVETPIVMVALRRFQPDLARLGVVILVGNLATHLAVWYVITQLVMVGTWQYLLVAESWAIAAEALLYWAVFRGLRFAAALGLAVFANLASFVAGRVLAGVWPDVFG